MIAKSTYRLAVVDLDDTLLGPDKRISPVNRAAVSALRRLGIEVVLASGRAVASMVPYYEELELTSFMISLNGAVVSCPAASETLRLQMIPAELDIAREGLAYGFTVVACCSRKNFASALTPLLARYQSRGGERDAIIGLPLYMADEGLLKLIWIGPPPALDAVQQTVLERYNKYLNVIRTESHHLEFMALEADKASGVRLVAEKLGVRPDQTIAVGDGTNDVGMLSWAGFGIAMGHAAPAIQAAAAFVGPEVNDPCAAFAAAIQSALPQIRALAA